MVIVLGILTGFNLVDIFSLLTLSLSYLCFLYIFMAFTFIIFNSQI